jgi:enterochelin esterase-like enzyme
MPGIWISCGLADDVVGGNDHLPVCENLHAYLNQEKVPNTFNTLKGGHDWTVWQPSLYYFVKWLQNP